jgi:phage shock protein C
MPAKKLYRSSKDRILGGICGGIAEYFNADPTIVRLLFVLLLLASFGTAVIGYLIAWIIIPRNPKHKW